MFPTTDVEEGTAVVTGVSFRTTGGGLEHCEDAEESQSRLLSIWWIGEGLFWGWSNECSPGKLPVLIKASSCAWARRRAVCMAITLWRSDVSRHFSHLQLRYLQYRLCPLRAIFMRWLRQRAQLGGVLGEADVLDAFTSIFESKSGLSDMSTLFLLHLPPQTPTIINKNVTNKTHYFLTPIIMID